MLRCKCLGRRTDKITMEVNKAIAETKAFEDLTKFSISVQTVGHNGVACCVWWEFGGAEDFLTRSRSVANWMPTLTCNHLRELNFV